MGSAAQVPNVGLQKVTTFGDNRIWAVGIGVILHSSDPQDNHITLRALPKHSDRSEATRL